MIWRLFSQFLLLNLPLNNLNKIKILSRFALQSAFERDCAVPLEGSSAGRFSGGGPGPSGGFNGPGTVLVVVLGRSVGSITSNWDRLGGL